jgi:hypothetical protein
MKFGNKAVGVTTATITLSFAPSVYAAQTIGTLAGHWSSQAAPIIGFITVCCYGFAFFFGLIGGKMLYDKNKNQSSSDPEAGKRIMAAFAAAIVLVAIPEVLGTGVMTVFGNTSNLTSATPTVPTIQ